MTDSSFPHRPDELRLHGPILSSLTANSIFAGDESHKRMDKVRKYITQVRSIWRETAKYDDLVKLLQHTIYNDHQSEHLKEEIGSLLKSNHDWADFVYERPGGTNRRPYAFIELYASREGYNYLYGLFNSILRMRDADDEKLLAAAFLTEVLTIELYNLRLSNIGDPLYSNYQGKVFRGMSVNSDIAEQFRKVATNRDLSQRHFSIPLGFISSTTSQNTMEEFGEGEPGRDQMYWIIHIHGLDPELLHRYEEKYPDSVVTSICAMPIASIAEFGEREILLRGAFFHILRMDSEKLGSQTIHTVEMVMLNSNRDHGTDLALHEGEKLVQRGYFNNIIRASRYRICASLTESYSIEDSAGYEKLEKEVLKNIEIAEKTMGRFNTYNSESFQHKTDLASSFSGPMATWIGDTSGKSFPRSYLLNRQHFHTTARKGRWDFVKYVLEREYDLRQADWFNVPELSSEVEPLSEGRTLLHELATNGPPDQKDPQNCEAWNYIIGLLSQREVWRTLRTSGAAHETAADIARKYGHENLAEMLRPKEYRQIPNQVLASLQIQLHELIEEYASEHLSGLAFRMPELCVLTEIQQAKLWIPIPGMYGGFLIELHEQNLRVILYRTEPGKVKSQRQEFELVGETGRTPT